MTELFVQKISRHHWPDEAGPDVDVAFREGLPRNAVRRMSRLALLCARVLREMPYDPETAVVYASGMSEARNLEDYLDSFPEPSPTRFQASVHPAGAQQALIALERPVREFYPLVGDTNLFDQALQTAALAESKEVVLVAGEEKGTWLLDLGLAEARSFAFALHLSRRSEEAQAVMHRRESPTEETAVKLTRIFDRLGKRTDWEIPAIPSGSWQWQWL